MITADTITDEQIRVLFGNGLISVDTAHEALNETVWPQDRAKARARCAEILNERATQEAAAATRGLHALARRAIARKP